MIHTTSADASDVLWHGVEEPRTMNCKTGLTSLPDSCRGLQSILRQLNEATSPWTDMAIKLVPIYKAVETLPDEDDSVALSTTLLTEQT